MKLWMVVWLVRLYVTLWWTCDLSRLYHVSQWLLDKRTSHLILLDPLWKKQVKIIDGLMDTFIKKWVPSLSAWQWFGLCYPSGESLKGQWAELTWIFGFQWSHVAQKPLVWAFLGRLRSDPHWGIYMFIVILFKPR